MPLFVETIQLVYLRNRNRTCIAFIALKTIFINFRETRLARVSKRFVSTNFPSDIALTNRVRGPYFKIRTEYFSARAMAQVPSVREKRGSITYRSDREKRG